MLNVLAVTEENQMKEDINTTASIFFLQNLPVNFLDRKVVITAEEHAVTERERHRLESFLHRLDILSVKTKVHWPWDQQNCQTFF